MEESINQHTHISTLRYILAAILLMLSFYLANADNKVPSTSPILGNVKGQVTDGMHQSLPGAIVRIDDSKIGTTTDVHGNFTLVNLKPGTYNITISYVGYKPITKTVTVSGNGTIQANVAMTEGTELKEVIVEGAFSGQSKALQLQKSHMGVTDVVSADQIGKFPDSNIGDALKRISGVNVQYDQGEARFGQVRGTPADYTSVTIDGNRIPSAEGDTRNVQLDLIPADMVQTIELNKVVTSDMDGDAIGGEINLVTKNTPNRRTLSFTAGSGYSWISEKPQLNLGFAYGDRFFNNKLGMMLAATYERMPGGSDNTEFEYDTDDDGNIVMSKAEVRQYYVTRERQSYSAAFDYKFNINNKISFKAIYNRRNDWENRYRISYKKLDSSAKKQNIVLQTKGGSDDNHDARLELQQTLDLSLHGDHQWGILGFDWGASFSRATEDRPEERYFGVKIKNPYGKDQSLIETFREIGGNQPYSTAAIPAISDDWSIDELSNSTRNIFENEFKGKLNFKLPLGEAAKYGKLKFGGKYVSKVKDRATEAYDYADSYEDNYGNEWQKHMAGQIRDGFMPGERYPINTPFITKGYLSSIDFSSLKGKPINEDIAGNYHAREQVSSAYLRYDIDFTRNLSMTAGLRFEHTALNYRGLNWTVDADEKEMLTPTGERKHSYNNWLPSILFKYEPVKDFLLRASYTQTISRPKYSHLIPSIIYNVQDEEATIGNEDLKATLSHNFDISADYYFPSVGRVGLGLFYKDIHDVVVDEQWKGSASEIPASAEDFHISKPVNGYDAGIFGTEISYERDFGFITPALKCIGFYGTYTYTHSKTRNYKFEHRVVKDGERITMAGTPEHSANASLYFNKWGFNARLSWNMASSFIDEMGSVAELDRYYDHVNYLDLNVGYTWGKKWKATVYVNATNLTNQPLRYYQGNSDRTMQVEYYGVRLNAGIKIKL